MKRNRLMPHNPDNWFTMIKHMPPWLSGVFMAVVIAILRVIYDKQETEWSRMFLEAAICGALTFASGGAVSALGMSEHWHPVIGGFIGFIGVQAVRKLAISFIEKRI